MYSPRLSHNPVMNHVELVIARFGVNAYKWVFWKRGIIKSPTTRLPVRKPFDLADQEELQRIMDRLSPLMT